MSGTGQQRTIDNLAGALAQIDEWVQPRGVLSAAAAVWYRGQFVAERYVGEAQSGQPVGPETLFGLASVTKPITGAVLMTLVDAGLIGLDDRVVDHLPEFAAAEATPERALDPALEARRSAITLRQLLCHTSGLPEDLGPRDVRFASGPDLATLTEAMCRLPLQSAPGAHLRYSNAGYAVLARLAERLSGEEFWRLARERLVAPLGLDRDIVARPGPDDAARIAHVVDAAGAGTPTESYNSAYWRDLAIPWGGLYGTPRALASFTGSFLPGFSAAHPLTPETRAEMIRDQAGGVPGGVESGKVSWPVASWGLGWEVKGAKTRHWTGERSSPATFCHFGQAGTLVWGDPAREVALAVFTGRTVTRIWGFFLTRWISLSDALVAAIDGDEPR